MWQRLLRRWPCGPLSVVRRPTPAANACITSSASDTRSSLRTQAQIPQHDPLERTSTAPDVYSNNIGHAFRLQKDSNSYQ